MNERTPTDRLEPCLLSRLTDDEPGKKKEGRDHRVISLRKYKAAVLRDIENLLNSRAKPLDDEIYDFPEAARSVLNYGLRDLCGLNISDVRKGQIESQVKDALALFEPRIRRETLSVQLKTSLKTGKLRSIALEIEGQLWPKSISDRLFVKTEMDVETGHYEFGEG